MPEQKMKITEEAFADFTGHMCRAGFTNSISNEPLSERQQNHLAACFRAIPFTQSVTITPAAPSVLAGKTVQLSAGITMSKSADSFTWTSANDQVATVSGTGLVTGVTPGKVKITATGKQTQLSASVEVTVKPVSVESVTVTPDSTSVEKRKSVKLRVDVQPSNATNKRVTWTSKNSDKATVDQNGNVAGIAVGTATIEVVSQDGSHKATATVEVTEPVVAVTGVSVDPSTTSVEANKTVQLTANIEPAGATNKRVTWASKNAEFATVDSATGLVTGVVAGTATIEVTTEDGSHKATATVEVTAAPAA
ncbi:Ig-like domain-containing protein [Enterobacter hormaechei]|uniref:Ig-like domain-containing protein n=1 Tax=Enterobacter hormaechei TaxID=158836 RepID=UPI001BD47A81|nr:Ig-like domain-containing protein [Enterobacter hormaechei]